MCYVDWPPGNLMKPCIHSGCIGTIDDQDVRFAAFKPALSWDIRNCPNISEGIYSVQLQAWNILDGWMQLDKPFTVEVLSRIGPIFIDDFNIINDVNEIKGFNFRFGKMGRKTCVTISWGDNSKAQFFGNALSCKQRFQTVTEDDVKSIDYIGKQFYEEHVYGQRGLYTVTVTGFDERNFAEATLDVTIFKMPCKVPQVWLPVNETSWLRPERVPKVFRSKSYQVAAISVLECNRTVVPWLEWSAFTVLIKKDPNSQAGLIEELTEIQINETVPTYQSSLIEVPPNVLDYGLYKLVFKLEIETGVPGLPLYKKAFTYFNVTKSPLVPGFIKGSVTKVTRGWGQMVVLNGMEYSTDPDYPDDKNFNFTWFCRRYEPEMEAWTEVFKFDSNLDGIQEEFPLYIPSQAQRIPRPRDPVIILPPPGCFGSGPGGIKLSASTLELNTSTLVTYAQVYEVALTVSKDERIAQTTILIDVGVIPAPIVEIGCASAGLCTPANGGIFINPTSRLALISGCIEECEGGILSYKWNIKLNTEKYPFRLNTVMCDPDLTTTTTTPTTTTTTTTVETTTTEPAVVITQAATFSDNGTNTTIYATQTTNGTIVTTYPDNNTNSTATNNTVNNTNSTGRRKRSISLSIGEDDTTQTEELFTGAQVLIPKQLKTGCSSVFNTGINQKEFSITTDFFQLNPKIRDFTIELNITRCINNGRKVSCSSGISTLNIMINDPPAYGKCVIKNLGITEENNPSAPGFNTALLDVFSITCSEWRDPNQHTIVKYVFKSKIFLCV